MMPEDLPPCICTAHNYTGGGGHFGGGGSSQWFTCSTCNRPCLMIYNHMGVLSYPSAPVDVFPEEGLDYINGKLNVTMRAYEVAVESAREAAGKAEWDLRCDLLGIPRGCKVDHVKIVDDYKRVLRRPDGSVVEDESAIVHFDAMYDDADHVQSSITPPTPPQVPAILTMYVKRGKTWQPVDRTLSAALHVPPDPRRVAHDKFFADIFSKLHVNLKPIELKPVEIPNRYYDDRNKTEPWYALEYNKKTFTVGPRKRVYAIQVESAMYFDPTALRLLAERDKVTYEADGRWQSKDDRAQKVEIHAYGGEKLVEYLCAALRVT